MSEDFRPPLPSDEVPACLKWGDTGTTNRAGGGDHYGYSDHLPATNFSTRSTGKTLTPTPLNFGTDDWTPSKIAPPSFGHSIPPAQSLFEEWIPSKNSITNSTPHKQDSFEDWIPSKNPGDEDEVWFSLEGPSTHPSNDVWLSSTQQTNTIVLEGDGYQILSKVKRACDEQSVDSEINFELNQIVGFVYGENSTRCKFAVQLVHDGGVHRAEFQCQTGPHDLFAIFFSTTSNCLQPKDSQVTSLPIPKLANKNATLEASVCKQLVEMCKSDFVDVRHEAMTSLVSLSCSQPSVIQESSTQEVVEVLVASNIPDEQWNVSCLAANMCQLPPFAMQAIALLPALFEMLACVSCLENYRIHREAARTLQILSTHHGNLLMLESSNTSKYMSILEGLLGTSDPALKASVEHIIMAP